MLATVTDVDGRANRELIEPPGTSYAAKNPNVWLPLALLRIRLVLSVKAIARVFVAPWLVLLT